MMLNLRLYLVSFKLYRHKQLQTPWHLVTSDDLAIDLTSKWMIIRRLSVSRAFEWCKETWYSSFRSRVTSWFCQLRFRSCRRSADSDRSIQLSPQIYRRHWSAMKADRKREMANSFSATIHKILEWGSLNTAFAISKLGLDWWRNEEDHPSDVAAQCALASMCSVSSPVAWLAPIWQWRVDVGL